MDLFNYEDFLPLYPNIYNEHFQQEILNKKEFYELRLETELEDRDSDGLLRHQKLIQRFLSPHTLYDELLVYHATGTGKTAVAFSVTENLYHSKSFKQVIVLAKGYSLLVSHRKDLIERYSKRYKPKIPEEMLEVPGQRQPLELIKQRNSFYRRVVGDFYVFITFETFAKHLAKLTDDVLIKNYSNSIFILDEIHNVAAESALKEAPRSKVRVYVQFHRLFHLIQNRKILLMSATPMRNDVYELAYIMNLILPMNKQLPIQKDFLKRFVQEDKIKNEELLKDYLRGRVSILAAAPSTIKVDYKGVFVSDLKVIPFKLFETTIESPQLESYIDAYYQDTQRSKSIYANVRQAALFVFPDGSYGAEGLKKYTTPSGNITNELAREINTISKLRKFSSKYAFIIQNLEENRNKLIYIYCNVVDGSGVDLLAKILDLYNYSRCRGTESLPGKRFIVLTAKTSNVGLLLDYFNHPRNLHGEYCQVIIGSRRISEGFTFKNVQIIHVATLFWNYTETQQAIARAIRYLSHADLIEAGEDPVVEVYQHASIVPKGKGKGKGKGKVESIDKVMMEYSQRKDVLIRRMDRVIKEISFDCPLTYERNCLRDGENDSRECDYDYCEYKCDDSSLVPTPNVDYSTYNLYYQSQDEQGVFEGVRELFRRHFALKFDTIQDTLQVERFQLVRVLSQIIRYNIPLVNAYDIECFLREDHNVYYLVDNVVLPNHEYNLMLYTRYPFISQVKTLENTIQDKVYQHCIQTINRIQKSENEENVKNNLEMLPVEMQELFLELAWIHPKTRLSQWIQSIYEPMIRSTNEYKVVSVLLKPRIRGFVPKEKLWRDCGLEDETETKEEQASVAVDYENNPYGYYGIVDEDRFCIKDITQAISEDGTKIDKRKIKTGSNCLEVGFNKPDLVEICIHLDLPIPSDALLTDLAEIRNQFMKTKSGRKTLLDSWNDWPVEKLAKGWYWYAKKKEQICDSLKSWFAEHNLLIRDECGKAGKVKEVKKTKKQKNPKG